MVPIHLRSRCISADNKKLVKSQIPDSISIPGRDHILVTPQPKTQSLALDERKFGGYWIESVG